jgi:HK97 family phage prohead protease
MELTRKLLASSSMTLADQRQVKVICSTGMPDRSGDVVVQRGIDLAAYRNNPIVLWNHLADVPIASSVDIEVKGDQLQATVQFPPEGEDEDSDWVYGKIKAGIVNATSIGFIPKDYEPLNPKEPWSGYKFKKSELLEFSFVSVPANSGCLIVGRSLFNGVDVPLLPSIARENGVATGTEESESGERLTEKNDPRVPKLVSALYKGDLEEAFRLAKTPRAVRQKFLVKEAADQADNSEATSTDDVQVNEENAAPVEKSGRSISSANRSLLQKAMDHHESATKCIKDVLGSNATDGDDPDGDDDNNMVVLADDQATPAVPAVEKDQRALRLAEAKALRASANL